MRLAGDRRALLGKGSLPISCFLTLPVHRALFLCLRLVDLLQKLLPGSFALAYGEFWRVSGEFGRVSGEFGHAVRGVWARAFLGRNRAFWPENAGFRGRNSEANREGGHARKP